MMFRYIFLTALLLFVFPFVGFGQQGGVAISTDGAQIHFKTFGAGKPLLIINGGPGMNSDGFENLAGILSKNNQTIIYDQRGTGKSVLDKIDLTTITMKLMLDDVESIRQQLGIATWSVLGHSFGGMVASAYAADYPERIDKIILSSSGGINLRLLDYVRASIDSQLSAEGLDSVAYWTAKIASGDTSYHARLERGRHLAPAYVYDPRFIPVIAERLTQTNQAVNQLMWAHLRSIGFDCGDKLKSFDGQVLIIQGKEDIVRSSTAEEAHVVFRHSRLVYMDHCKHYGWLDNPEVYFREVNSFLAAGM